MNKDVNIEEIIDFIKSNLTNEVNLINNLGTIESGEWESKAYYRFVNSKNTNQSGSKWKFKETIILEQLFVMKLYNFLYFFVLYFKE